jgi:DNA-binding response OmpR family regulator
VKKILVVEDEDTIREFIVLNLKRGGYEVVEAADGEAAIEKYEEDPENLDIAILDIMLPGAMDGLAVCKYLRKKSLSLGIILLTAKTQEMDKVSGLMFGADDYMTKPFSPSELVARVDALYRRAVVAHIRAENNFKEEIVLGKFKLNLRSHALFKDSKAIDLTHIEFQIVEFLFSNPGIALSRKDISKHAWGQLRLGDEKIVDVNIRRLRMKIEDNPSEPQYILTVWGLGYKWAN